MYSKINKLVLFFAISLFCNCAQIVQPTGGTTDKQAPKLLQANPKQKALNVNTTSFDFEFDEFINASELGSKLIISPPIKSIPKIKVGNKSLNITLNDTLTKNTTYTFYFNGAIKDLTENNKDESLDYVFSTGNYIDTLKCKGSILNAETAKPEIGVTVMLYNNWYDSIIYKEVPSYFAKTNAEGVFTINNIKAAAYKILCLKDANGNFKYDQTKEEIGFNKETITLTKDTNINLKLFKEDNESFYAKSTVIGQGYLRFEFSKAFKEIKIFDTEINNLFVAQKTDLNKKQIEIWHNSIDTTERKIIIQSNYKIDTALLFLKPYNIKNKSGKQDRTDAAVLNLVDFKTSIIEKDSIYFTFNKPINTIDTTKIVLIGYTDTVFKQGFKLPFNYIKKDFFNIYILPNAKYSSYKLTLYSGAFTDFTNKTNDTIKKQTVVVRKNALGILKLKFKPANTTIDYIVILLNGDKEITKKIIIKNSFNKEGISNIVFDNLPPALYSLKLIEDENSDKQWSTGNYLKAIQAEKIIKYTGSDIKIRVNWEIEQEWILKE